MAGRQAAMAGRQAAMAGRQAAMAGRQAAMTGRQAAMTGRLARAWAVSHKSLCGITFGRIRRFPSNVSMVTQKKISV